MKQANSQNHGLKGLEDSTDFTTSKSKNPCHPSNQSQSVMQTKYSGIEWMGNVPNHWKRDKLFRICSEMGSGGTPKSTNEGYYDGDIPWIQSGDLNDGYVSETKKKINEEALVNSSAKMFPKGTLLVAMYGATIGKLGIMEMDAATNQACCALQLSTKLLSKYIYYVMIDIRDYLITQAYGGGQPNISQEVLKQQYLYYPPLPEQKAIADYLDKACARIDRIIAIKEEQLRKIEGYYSSLRHKLITLGINNTDFISYDDDFLKKVPKHWKKQKLRYLLELKNGKLITNDELVDDGEIPVYGGNGIMGRTDKYNYDGELLILGRVGAKCGNVHYTNQKIWVSDNAISVRSIINYQYMYQLLTVIDLHRLASETAQPLLVGNNVKKLYVAIPPISEQMQIIEKIEAAHLKTQNLKKKVSLQIKTLQSYRKSLIHECVTGKKQVADVSMNDKQEINA